MPGLLLDGWYSGLYSEDPSAGVRVLGVAQGMRYPEFQIMRLCTSTGVWRPVAGSLSAYA
jgi:hypothetical protein